MTLRSFASPLCLVLALGLLVGCSDAVVAPDAETPAPATPQSASSLEITTFECDTSFLTCFVEVDGGTAPYRFEWTHAAEYVGSATTSTGAVQCDRFRTFQTVTVDIFDAAGDSVSRTTEIRCSQETRD